MSHMMNGKQTSKNNTALDIKILMTACEICNFMRLKTVNKATKWVKKAHQLNKQIREVSQGLQVFHLR